MGNNKIPNLFLVGYPKTGTTSLFSILSKHHNVCSSKLKEPGDCKELKNFDKIHQEQYQEYLNNFNHCEHETYLMEGSTQYILNQHSALKIKNFNPEAKIIIGLREPISYISSLCFQIEKNSGKPRDLKKDILNGRPYTKPNYYNSVKAYLDVFGYEHVKIYIFEQFKNNNQEVLNDIFRFLGFDLPCNINMERKNISREIKSDMHNQIYDYLLYSKDFSMVRSTLKSLGFSRDGRLNKIINYYFTKPVNHKIKLDEEVTTKLRHSFYKDLDMLSNMLEKDLLTIWKYDKS